ncbi:hypothetical protein OF385_07065 [Glutamicibacter sp. JL.03c]|uniref:hypothetical protein n=1 Tax=Glutamicibacter sp. JL.03c TaxID=2984842 RepID=UPI0021F7B308|nr:hypothetical protein [Glutamicibacter sp. JL.03c]UYQ78891.1 hypothetical protein OF385_07065 [Glutamicibacter sp. JL.03c]
MPGLQHVPGPAVQLALRHGGFEIFAQEHRAGADKRMRQRLFAAIPLQSVARQVQMRARRPL